MYEFRDVSSLEPDPGNPRKPDPARLHLLRLSISRLGFIIPIAITADGLVLSGHQRLTVARQLKFKQVPVQVVEVAEDKIRGINVMYNRVTNDLGALDTGSEVFEKNHLQSIVDEAEKLPVIKSVKGWQFPVRKSLLKLGTKYAHLYDKKAIVAADNFIRLGIEIPIVVSESGEVVNGIHRLLAARESGITEWPIITIPDEHAEFANHFLNYLSMDYSVDGDFATLLRYSAYRRPQNNRGSLPKAMRFWGNNCRTVPDKQAYSTDFWRSFRDIHGNNVLDFGAGLGKVKPFLEDKGINCLDFEPYRINPESEHKKPDPEYSREQARVFLQTIANPDMKLDAIFLASVLNSVPFPQDRMAVLLIVHALSAFDTGIYGTCRDRSDFHYEYAGIRQANYFVFDSEPGVRLGDAISNPKIQKFMTQEEADSILKKLWNTRHFFPGGNIFYFEAHHPKRVNPVALSQALAFEFEILPYSDGSVMGLGELAVDSFSKRLGMDMPLITREEVEELFGTSGN